MIREKLKSNILKIAIFATGLSGIVAEYILSTLASYFLGDSVIQWTLIISVMMFAMGLGSRLSKYINKDLLIKFIYLEFSLSIIVAISPLVTYLVAAHSTYTGIVIYSFSVIIGLLIGLEIPLVIRINDSLEELKINVSSIIEKDYYGSLLGGLFYAFVALPYIGITYTPFILGTVNFVVAFFVMIILVPSSSVGLKKKIYVFAAIVVIIILGGLFAAKPIILYGEQVKYSDKIVFVQQSKYQKIVITQWRENYWLYIDGNQQLSTLDEYMYHEPLVHPVMKLSKTPQNVLILGGGDGCAAREILKYPEVKTITVIDLDPVMTNLALENDILKSLNENSFSHPKVEIINQDAFIFAEKTESFYDVIIIDLPDPRTVELGRLYSVEFYKRLSKILRTNGIIITQAGSPYYASRAFNCITKTVDAAGFSTAQLHNQIITMGEWGWVIGVKGIDKETLKKALINLDFSEIKTRWINKESMSLMTSFGKNIYGVAVGETEINTIHNPVLYSYYLNGNWDIY